LATKHKNKFHNTIKTKHISAITEGSCIAACLVRNLSSVGY